MNKIGAALAWTELADPQPGPDDIRVKVSACGVCRTDLHVVDGELPDPKLPIIPGHEIVERIDSVGTGVKGLKVGERVGIPWLGHTCGVCSLLHGRSGKPLRPATLQPATPGMAVSRRWPSPMRALRFRSVKPEPTWHWLRCSAPV